MNVLSWPTKIPMDSPVGQRFDWNRGFTFAPNAIVSHVDLAKKKFREEFGQWLAWRLTDGRAYVVVQKPLVMEEELPMACRFSCSGFALLLDPKEAQVGEVVHHSVFGLPSMRMEEKRFHWYEDTIQRVMAPMEEVFQWDGDFWGWRRTE